LGLILGANDVPHRIACKLQITRNRLDLPLLYEVRPTNPRDRIHSHHPPLDPWRESRTRGGFSTRGWGQNWTPITPKEGSKLHAAQQQSRIVRGRLRQRTSRYVRTQKWVERGFS